MNAGSRARVRLLVNWTMQIFKKEETGVFTCWENNRHFDTSALRLMMQTGLEEGQVEREIILNAFLASKMFQPAVLSCISFMQRACEGAYLL